MMKENKNTRKPMSLTPAFAVKELEYRLSSRLSFIFCYTLFASPNSFPFP